jgi:hypothetical protein
MAVIYGWTWAEFNASVSHNFEDEADYLRWENHFAHEIENYIFDDVSDAPLTDADEITSVKGIVHRLLVELSVFQKGNATQGGFVTRAPQFPQLRGDPLKEMGSGMVGSGDYQILNRIKSNHQEGDDLIWSIRAWYDGNAFASGKRLIF